MPLTSSVVRQIMPRFRNFHNVKKVKALFKKAQSVLNRCKDLFKPKKYFGVRCTLKLRNLNLQLSTSKTLYISLSVICVMQIMWALQADTYLHQCVEEHKRSVISNHVREQHGNEPCEIAKNFRVLRKCSSKFDCLIFEMFFIRDLKPKLNKQSESIRAKLFA